MFCKAITLRTALFASLLCLVSSNLNAGSLFRPGGRFSSGGGYAVSIAAADLNGDGFTDLVVAHWYGGVTVLLGDRGSQFHWFAGYSTGSAEAHVVVVADVNGDGKPDLVISLGDGTAAVLLGNGDGTFQPAVQYSTGGVNAISIAVADVNADLKPDLLVANQFGGAGVLLGNGDGTFQPAHIYDSGGYQANGIAVADINGDGRPDLIVANVCYSYPPCDTGGVAVLFGYGDGTFQAAQQYSSGSYGARNIAVADVSGDKYPDLLIGNDGGVTVMLGNGDGTFQPAQLCDAGGWEAAGIAVADVNGDGKPDLLVADSFPTQAPNGGTSGLSVLLGNGDGTFQPGDIYATGGYQPMSIAVADVNRDLMPDAIVASECSPGRACRNGYLGLMINTTKGFITSTELTSNLNPSVYGQTVVLTASVKSAGQNVPTRSVMFESGGEVLGTVSLNGGVASFKTARLGAGTASITATYKGDAHSLKSTSSPLSQVVQQAQSRTTIQSSKNPSAQGAPVKITVTVASPSTMVSEIVTLKLHSEILGDVTLQGGKASLTTSSLPKGRNRITATYEGTPNIAGSSAMLIQIVN